MHFTDQAAQAGSLGDLPSVPAETGAWWSGYGGSKGHLNLIMGGGGHWGQL